MGATSGPGVDIDIHSNCPAFQDISISGMIHQVGTPQAPQAA